MEASHHTHSQPLTLPPVHPRGQRARPKAKLHLSKDSLLEFRAQQKDVDVLRFILQQYPGHKIDMRNLFEEGRNGPNSMLDAFPTVPSSVKSMVRTMDSDRLAQFQRPKKARTADLAKISALPLDKIKEKLTALIASGHRPGRGLRLPVKKAMSTTSVTSFVSPGSLTSRTKESEPMGKPGASPGGFQSHKTMVARYNEMMTAIDKLCDDVGKTERKGDTIMESYREDREDKARQYALTLKMDKRTVLPKYMKERFRNQTIKKFMSMPERYLNS